MLSAKGLYHLDTDSHTSTKAHKGGLGTCLRLWQLGEFHVQGWWMRAVFSTSCKQYWCPLHLKQKPLLGLWHGLPQSQTMKTSTPPETLSAKEKLVVFETNRVQVCNPSRPHTVLLLQCLESEIVSWILWFQLDYLTVFISWKLSNYICQMTFYKHTGLFLAFLGRL